MKVEVKVIKKYKDADLKTIYTTGETMEMPREKADKLKRLGFIEIIKEVEEATIEEEVETAIEKPKKKKK